MSQNTENVEKTLAPNQIELITKLGEKIICTIATANNKRRLAHAKIAGLVAQDVLRMDEISDRIQKLHDAKKECDDDAEAAKLQAKIDSLFQEVSQLQITQVQRPIEQLKVFVNIPNVEIDGESRKRSFDDIDWDECETAQIQRGIDFFTSSSNGSTHRSNS